MFNLEPAREYRLARPPLVQVLLQLQFPMVARLATLSGVAQLQESLQEYFPYMERVSETSLSIDFSSEPDVRSEQNQSWHFTDDDGRLLAVTTTALTFSLSNDQYDGVANFLEWTTKVIATVQRSLNLRRCGRIGLRFLDLVEDDESDPAPWRRLFRQELLGWPASEVVEPRTRVDSSIGQTQLTGTVDDGGVLPSPPQAVVRHGVADAGSVVPGFPPVVLGTRSFLLDLDFFVATQQRFDPKSIGEQARAMHREIDGFFRWSLSPDGEKHFGLKEV